MTFKIDRSNHMDFWRFRSIGACSIPENTYTFKAHGLRQISAVMLTTSAAASCRTKPVKHCKPWQPRPIDGPQPK